MYGWIVYCKRDAERNKDYINFYIEEGLRLGIRMQLILTEELEFGIRNDLPFLSYIDRILGLEAKRPDFVISRTIYPLLTQHFEDIGIPVFNNSEAARICNDKALTYAFAARHGIKTINTVFCRSEELPHYYQTGRIQDNSIIKAVAGHGGTQVFLYKEDEPKGFADILNGLGGQDVVIQPLIGRGQDLRVYMLGSEIIAAVLRTAKNGFKSNFSLGGDVRSYELSSEERDVVERISSVCSFDYVGIDFIIGEDGELILNEIEDVVGARMLYQCTDINIVRLYLRYILDKLIK